jgi:hypothetical protein
VAFCRDGGTDNYTDKGKSVEFIGLGANPTVPDEINTLDMTATAKNIVLKHGFTDILPSHTPAAPNVTLSERD